MPRLARFLTDLSPRGHRHAPRRRHTGRVRRSGGDHQARHSMKRATSMAVAALFAVAASSAFAHGMPERVFKERKPIRAETPQQPQRDAPSPACARDCAAGAKLSQRNDGAPGANPRPVNIESAAGAHSAVSGG
nr:hypothetical protein [Burkholderia sp. MSMB617WGS]